MAVLQLLLHTNEEQSSSGTGNHDHFALSVPPVSWPSCLPGHKDWGWFSSSFVLLPCALKAVPRILPSRINPGRLHRFFVRRCEIYFPSRIMVLLPAFWHLVIPFMIRVPMSTGYLILNSNPLASPDFDSSLVGSNWFDSCIPELLLTGRELFNFRKI